MQSLSGRSDNTIKRDKASVKAFYKWLAGNDEYPDNVRWIKHKSKKRLPTNIPDEATIKKIIEHGKYQRDRALLFVLYDSGCRIGEILNMKVGDVTFDNCGAFFICDGKTGQRRVRLIDSVPDLQTWYNEHPRGNEKDAPLWVQVNSATKAITYHGVRQMLQRTAAYAGFTGINAHKFRHAKLTKLAEDFSESELKVIAGWVGESHMSGTYVHLSGTDIERKSIGIR